MTGLPGHVGGFAATITTPLGGASTHVMASGRDYNHPKTNGMLAQTGRLGNWVRKKIDGLSCSAAPVVRGKERRPPHLLKNGPKAGYFDYAAFGKYESVKRGRVAPAEPPPVEQPAEVANPLDAVKFLRGAKTLPGAVDAATLTALALECADGDAVAERALISALLLNQLPGLGIDRTGPDRDIIKPDEEKIRATMARYRERVSDLQNRLGALEDANRQDHLIEDLQEEIDRCNGCIEILDSALSKIQRFGQKPESPAFWSTNLWKRWGKYHPDDNLFEIVSKHRDLDDIAKHYRFIFIPQERCLLEMRIAVEELLDIYRSKALTSEQFAQLVEALACGWPSVKEDSESERPERRADAAGCVRALAQLANRGRLPRDVLARFPEFDAINRALLRYSQTRSVTELYKAQTELHLLDGTGARKGKGKEKETDDPERQRLGARIAMLREEIATIVPEFDRDADLTAMPPEERRNLVAVVRENGTKLAALYGELQEASRNLAVVGIDVGDVRVDEYFIHGLDRVAPKLRKQAALMLARVALIEAEIAKINPKFQRHFDDKSNNRKSRDEISRRMELDTLLRLGLTRDDLLDMDLSDDQLDVIHKLGELGFRNAGEVKLQNRMHRKIRNRIFNTNAGRSIARTAFGLTTAQLAREYLDMVFRAVTGNSRKFDHQADDREVRQAMKQRWREIMTLSPEQVL